MTQFRNRVFAITGAGSGIGRALALQLASEGARLALSDIDPDGLEKTRSHAASRGIEVSATTVDVADRQAVHDWADSTAEQYGEVHGIINNAGVTVIESVSDISYEDFDWLMGIDFWGVVHGTRAFLPYLKQVERGYVVNISSMLGLISVPAQSAYNAAKFAVRGFTESLRQELELDDIPVSVTCVHPGGVRTNVVRSARVGGAIDKLGGIENFSRVFEQTIAAVLPERAASIILNGVRQGDPRVLVGLDAVAVDILQRLLPAHYGSLLVKLFKWRERTNGGRVL